MNGREIIETDLSPALLLWWQWLGLAIVVVATLLLIRILTKNKQPKPPAPAENLSAALEQLEEIRQKTLNTRELATQLSIITRQYLQNQFEDPALFETHQEFNTRSRDIKKLPPEAANRLTAYLTETANLKYSPEIESTETQNTLIKNTESLLRGLDSTIPKNIDPR